MTSRRASFRSYVMVVSLTPTMTNHSDSSLPKTTPFCILALLSLLVSHDTGRAVLRSDGPAGTTREVTVDEVVSFIRVVDAED